MALQFITTHVDLRGVLTAVDFTGLPFIPVRMFGISQVPAGTKRGDHAHVNSKQYIVVISGTLRVNMLKRRDDWQMFTLSAGQTLYIPNMVWSSETFVTKETTIAVFSDHQYDKDDYIHDYNEFLNQLEKANGKA